MPYIAGMREENFRLNHEERDAQLDRLKSKPFLLRFAFSENCNLRCPYCRGEWTKSGYLPFGVVRAMDSVFPYVKKVWLFGNGEPLMHPEFREISEHIAAFGCCVFGMTPAGNLNETPFEEIWNGQVFHGLRRSVNGPNPPALCGNCLDDSQKRDVLSPSGFMSMEYFERYTSGGK